MAEEQGAGKDQRKSLFQQGLENLIAGRLEEAHGNMSRYLALSEAEDDLADQARGHFFLAMIYEQNAEPCMAAAQVEMGRDVAEGLISPWSHARLTSFLAHLWLKRGELKEARAFQEEAMRKAGEAPGEGAGPCLGMILLVDAEVKAIISDQEGGERSFRWSRETFLNSPWGEFYQAVACCWYGETLIEAGRAAEGGERLEESAALFRKLGNGRQVERVERLLAGK
ncbi:hypothetical protein [Methanomassiliicoccus luminyensis]|uniref:hypothetical protein n=2 Tax=Methanomassiliicoccus luminyensis TaxID=1080712 RepID=UPI001F26E968|nr:hypothetical protein [Methanomassiliicoccus luminyensis]